MYSRLNLFLLAALLCAGSFLQGGTVLESPFRSNDELKAWYAMTLKPEVRDGALVLALPSRSDARGLLGITRQLPVKETAGKRLRLSAEFKGENIAPSKEPWNGAKFQLQLTLADGSSQWLQGNMPLGTFDWEPVSFVVNVPAGAQKANLNIGFQDSSGVLQVRNLKAETLDTCFDLSPVANMGLKDEVEGDGKGGWSDQGPDNDARNFNFKQPVFGNVPFFVLDPARNSGKSILVFRSEKFPSGLREATVPLAGKPERAKYLYLLHSLCWGDTGTVGSLEISGSGKTQTWNIEGGKDVSDWWAPRNLSNGFVGATWNTASGGRVGMYVSRFELEPSIGEISRLTFRTADRGPVWIVAGATLSDTGYQFPSQTKFTLKPDAEWKTLKRPESPVTLPGSALDRSGFLPQEKAGSYGRVIITPQGKFAFEKRPDVPIRFFSSADGSETFWGRRDVLDAQFDSHERIKAYVEELRRNGYNMVRTHFLDTALMRGAKNDLELSPEMLDKFDYFVHCLKENGIYLNFDAMSSWVGYTTQNPWGGFQGDNQTAFKYTIYFDPAVRRHWAEGVKRVLGHINPYTQTRLAEDPVLALVVGFNEQEFAFVRRFDPALNAPAWREFLRKRYGSMEKLKAAWGSEAPSGDSFDALPGFTAEEIKQRNAKSTDISLFRLELESDITNWYRDELRKMGYPGPVSNHNMAKSFHYIAARSSSDVVTMNSYHAHPSDYMREGSTISQNSSIAAFGNTLRWSMVGRLAGKPFAMTEYAHTFWNQYRYEQAFVSGAYAAFQDMDIMTAFAQPVNVTPGLRIHPFSIFHDPVARAMEFLTFFLYRRGDVAPADLSIRLSGNVEEFYRGGRESESLTAGQSKLFLIGKLSVEGLEKGKTKVPLAPGEVEIPLTGGAAVNTSLAGFASVSDVSSQIFDADLLVKQLKERKLLPETNRSRPLSSVFESSTGELFMDSRKNFVSIQTPNLQGIAAEAGTKADLGTFRVDEMSIRGCLALVGVDGNKPLADSRRMVLVIATDALNDGMVFDEKERITLRDIGSNPTLVRTGSFVVAVRTKSDLKLYPLTMTGARGKAIAPIETAEGELRFRINTGDLPDGPAIYFELAE